MQNLAGRALTTHGTTVFRLFHHTVAVAQGTKPPGRAFEADL